MTNFVKTNFRGFKKKQNSQKLPQPKIDLMKINLFKVL